jgi:hypothetical protein
MAEEKKWYDIILDYVAKDSTYATLFVLLKAFGVKISTNLEQAIAEVGVAAGEFGKAIENLVLVVEEEKKLQESTEKAE